MTPPERLEPVRVVLPLADWQEIRRRQEHTRAFIERIRLAQQKLERAVDRATDPTTK